LPTTTSTLAINGPAFFAFVPSTLTITSNVSTLVAFSSESFDTASCFNNTGSTVGGIPAYSFLPNVAGYYQFGVTINTESGVSPTRALISLNKSSGIGNKRIIDSLSPLNAVNSSALVYMNGTTDAINVTAYITATTASMTGDATGEYTYFSGFLARAA
jgi:hypothetical protein